MSPDCRSIVISNLWFSLMIFENAGDCVEGHKHFFDHCTLLAHGSFNIVKYNELGEVELNDEYVAPCVVYIEKDKIHKVTSLSNKAVAYCCHAIYENETDKFPVDPKSIPLVGGSLKLPLTYS